MVILTVTTGNESQHQSQRGKWSSSPHLSNTPDTPGEHIYTHVQIQYLTVLFPFFSVNRDITRCCNGSLSAANTSPFLQEGREIWTFPTVKGGGVGEAHPEVECKYLAYFLNKRDWTVPQEYLGSCPGDHQPGSAHQDKNYTQKQK